MLLKNQADISAQIPLPVENVDNGQKAVSVSEPSVQLYYYNGNVLTADSGQPANNLVIAKLINGSVLNSIGSAIATKNNTSLSFTSTALTKEVEIDWSIAEKYSQASGETLLRELTNGLDVGEYIVDYRTGTIYGKKASAQTTLTNVTYKYASSSATIVTGDVQIGAVEIKDASADNRATVVRADAAKTGSTMVLMTQNIDSSGNIGGGSSPSTIADYKSPADFTATYTSNTTITLSGLPITINDNSQIKYIMVVPAAGQAKIFINGSGGVTITHSADVLTITGAGTPFASGDAYEVGINGQDKAYDLSTDAYKTINLTPESSKYVQDSLVDTTNVAAATNYYPSSTGMSMDGYKDFSLSGKFIDADGTMTLSIEATNDEDTTNADWIDISLLGIDSKTGINVITSAMTVTNGTLTFGIEYNNLNYSNIRVKMVNNGATNTAIIKARRKAL